MTSRANKLFLSIFAVHFITVSFKNLSLDRTSIQKAVEGFPNYKVHKVTSSGKDRFNFLIEVDGHKEKALITVIHLKDGQTTLQVNTGKNIGLSEEIGKYIVNGCTIPNIESKRLYISKMEDNDFQTLLEYLNLDERLKVSDALPLEKGKKYVISWHEGGEVHINRYDSKAFSIQGKSNHIKAVIVEILTKVLPYDKVINVQLEALEVNITPDQVLSEVENLMPQTFAKVNKTLLAIISPSFALRSSSIELPDYSAFVFPILRGLEGSLREIFAKHHIPASPKTVGSVFDIDQNTGRYLLQASHSATIGNTDTVDAINSVYNVYNSQRHELFHVGEYVEFARVVETKEEAERIIAQASNVLEELYIRL